MIQTFIFIFFFLCTISCFIIFRDIICPPVILSIVWSVVFGFYLFAPFNNLDENPYYLIFPFGHLLFILGYLFFHKVKYSKKEVYSKRMSNQYSINSKRFKILLLIQFLILMSVLSKALSIISGNFIGNWWFSLKYANSIGVYENGVIFDYTRIASFVIAYILSALFFLTKEKKIMQLFLMQLILASVFAVMSLGRTFLFQLYIPVFFMYIIFNSNSNRKFAWEIV